MMPRPCPARARVLLVDGSVPVRQRIRSLIEEAGAAEVVGEVDSAAAAIAFFHTHAPDAVVLDLHLAEGDALNVLRAIKHTRPACLVIVLTNFTDPEFQRACWRQGADYFLHKTLEFERVPSVLAALHRAPSPSRDIPTAQPGNALRRPLVPAGSK